MPTKLQNAQIKKKLNLKNDIIFKAFFSKKGNEKYQNAREVIAIYILNYNLFGFDDYILDTVKVLNKHREYQVNSISKEYYIQLPKFRESSPDMNNKLNQWLAIIDDEDRGKIEMAKSKNKIIKEAEVEIRYFTAEEEARYLADMRDLWESDRNSEIYDAVLKAEKEAKEREKIATKKAIKEGKKQEKIEIAKEMKNKGMNHELISEITKLTIKEIEDIK